jgi:hypothetical protein
MDSFFPPCFGFLGSEQQLTFSLSLFIRYSTRSASTSSGASSGVGANAAATTSAPSGGAAAGATVGFGLLAAGVVFALAA